MDGLIYFVCVSGVAFSEFRLEKWNIHIVTMPNPRHGIVDSSGIQTPQGVFLERSIKAYICMCVVLYTNRMFDPIFVKFGSNIIL